MANSAGTHSLQWPLKGERIMIHYKIFWMHLQYSVKAVTHRQKTMDKVNPGKRRYSNHGSGII